MDPNSGGAGNHWRRSSRASQGGCHQPFGRGTPRHGSGSWLAVKSANASWSNQWPLPASFGGRRALATPARVGWGLENGGPGTLDTQMTPRHLRQPRKCPRADESGRGRGAGDDPSQRTRTLRPTPWRRPRQPPHVGATPALDQGIRSRIAPLGCSDESETPRGRS